MPAWRVFSPTVAAVFAHADLEGAPEKCIWHATTLASVPPLTRRQYGSLARRQHCCITSRVPASAETPNWPLCAMVQRQSTASSGVPACLHEGFRPCVC